MAPRWFLVTVGGVENRFEIIAVSITAVLLLLIGAGSYMLGQAASSGSASPVTTLAVDIRPTATTAPVIAAGGQQPATTLPATVPVPGDVTVTTTPGVGFESTATTLLPAPPAPPAAPSFDALTSAMAAIGIEATSSPRLEPSTSGEVFSIDGSDSSNVYLVLAGSTNSAEETAAFVASFANSMALGDRNAIVDNGDGTIVVNAPDAVTVLITDGAKVVSVSVAAGTSTAGAVAADTAARLLVEYDAASGSSVGP